MKEIYKALNIFFEREYGDTELSSFEDLRDKIDLCYTTSEDDEYELQVCLNLKALCYEYYIDGDLVKEVSVDKEELINDLNNASFDDMIFDISLLADEKNNELVL